MPKLSIETQTRRKRDLLVAAAAILARQPQASMADIAEHAGVGRATVYRYFPAREDLIRAICIEALDRTDAACQHVVHAPTCAKMLRQIFDAVIPLGAEFHFLYTESVGLRDAEVDARFARQLEQTRQMIEWGKATGEIDAQLPTVWLVRLVDTAIWNGWAALARDGLAPDVVARLAFDTLWPGIRAPGEPQ